MWTATLIKVELERKIAPLIFLVRSAWNQGAEEGDARARRSQLTVSPLRPQQEPPCERFRAPWPPLLILPSSSADIAFSLVFHLSGVFLLLLLLLPPSLSPSLLSPSDPSALLRGTPPLPATSACSWTLSVSTFQWRISVVCAMRCLSGLLQ